MMPTGDTVTKYYRAVARYKIAGGAARQRRTATDVIRDFFTDHDGGRVQVAGDNKRHDGRIHHAQAFQPVHAAFAIHNGHLIAAHFAAAARVIGGLGMVADKFVKLFIGLAVDARTDFPAAEFIQRGLVDNLARDANGVAELLPVLLVRHIVKQDSRVLARIARFNAHVTAARRAHGADVTLETVRFDGVRAVVVNRHRQKVVLNVRPGERFAAADKPAALKVVAGADTSAVKQPLRADFRLVPPFQRRIERHRLFALVLQIHLQVILKILADARQIMHHRNIKLFQQFSIPHAGSLEDLRRGDGACAEQHFAARMNLLRRVAGTMKIFHARRAFVLKKNTVSGGMGDDFQVRALLRGIQIAARGAGAAAFRRDEAIHRAEAFLLIAIQIVGARIARLHARLNHRREQRIVARFAGGDADRAVAAVVVVRADIARLGFTVVGQAVEVCPALKAGLLRPVVEIHRVAAHVAHAVNQRRAAKALAAPALHAAVVHIRLRLGFIGPVITFAL
ncbi:protein of unknown function DUF140 [Cronobacter turicensis 564]|nr:protein of unknown function DUF140 [Cronobacter turicensis 564]